MQSKNSRIGRLKDKNFGTSDILPKHNPGNVGATWKIKNRQLDFRIRRKVGKRMYQRIGNV